MSTNAGGIIYELQLDAPEKIDYSVICEEIMGDG